MKPTPEHLALADVYQLQIHHLQRSGRNGEIMGTAAGTSTDFLDHRPYVAGDDIRRIDWGAFARTDQLLLKRFQEEIRPVVDIWIDGSSSMKISERKAQQCIDIAAFFYQLAKNAAVDVQLRVLGKGRIQPEHILLGEMTFDGRESLEDTLKEESFSVRRGSHIILLSDFLSPHDPRRIIASFRNRAATVTFIQILAQEDLVIEEGSSVLLQDSETEEIIEMDLDSSSIALYYERLAQLQEDLKREVLHRGGVFQVWPHSMDFRSGCNLLVQQDVLIL
jgi:uncharacterized protein (DUF58 family)